MATMKDVYELLRLPPDPTKDNEPILVINQMEQQRLQAGGYPLNLYHETLEPQTVTNRSQEQRLMSLGYQRNYIPRDYPKWLYRRNQQPQFAPQLDLATKRPLNEPWIESRLVASKDAEEALKKEHAPPGCGPWVRSIDDIEPLPPEPVEAPAVRIARQEGELAALRAQAEKRK